MRTFTLWKLRDRNTVRRPSVNRVTDAAQYVALLAMTVLALNGGSPARGALSLPPYEVYLSGAHPGGVAPMTTPGTLDLRWAFQDPIADHDEFLNGYVTGKLGPPTVEAGVFGDNLLRFGNSSPYAGGASGSIKYYFGLENPAGIQNIAVPIVIESQMNVRTQNSNTQHDWSQASVQLRIGQYDITTGRDMWYSDPAGTLASISYPGTTSETAASQLFMGKRDYLPLQIGVVRITASGELLYVDSYGGGSFQSSIDPFIYVDPDFLVEVNGKLLRGSEVFPIRFSEGIVQVPEPATLVMFLAGVLAVASRRLASWRRA